MNDVRDGDQVEPSQSAVRSGRRARTVLWGAGLGLFSVVLVAAGYRLYRIESGHGAIRAAGASTTSVMFNAPVSVQGLLTREVRMGAGADVQTVLRFSPRLPHLDALTLEQCEVTPELAEQLRAALVGIKTLSLIRVTTCPEVWDVIQASGLENVSLRGMPVTDEMAAKLVQMANIRSVGVDGCDLDTQVVPILCAAQQITGLQLSRTLTSKDDRILACSSDHLTNLSLLDIPFDEDLLNALRRREKPCDIVVFDGMISKVVAAELKAQNGVHFVEVPRLTTAIAMSLPSPHPELLTGPPPFESPAEGATSQSALPADAEARPR